MMDVSHSEGPSTTFVDDYRRMRSSNDSSLVFGLRAFDARETVFRVLPGQFDNLVQVLVPDVAAKPMEFHDIILEDLVGTPDF